MYLDFFFIRWARIYFISVAGLKLLKWCLAVTVISAAVFLVRRFRHHIVRAKLVLLNKNMIDNVRLCQYVRTLWSVYNVDRITSEMLMKHFRTKSYGTHFMHESGAASPGLLKTLVWKSMCWIRSLDFCDVVHSTNTSSEAPVARQDGLLLRSGYYTRHLWRNGLGIPGVLLAHCDPECSNGVRIAEVMQECSRHGNRKHVSRKSLATPRNH